MDKELVDALIRLDQLYEIESASINRMSHLRHYTLLRAAITREIDQQMHRVEMLLAHAAGETVPLPRKS